MPERARGSFCELFEAFGWGVSNIWFVKRDMPLTQTQRGFIGQTEAVKLSVLTSDGEVECATPATDDEHRDVETHLRHLFADLALQVKTTWRLWTHRRSEIIQIPFRVRTGRPVSHPHFYYLFGFFDRKAMTFADPMFLVPSTVVHKHAMPRLVKGEWRFTFQASMKPGAKDRFSPYRVSPGDVGKHLAKILRDLEKRQTDRNLPPPLRGKEPGNLPPPLRGRVGVGGLLPEEVLWVSRRKRTTISKAA